jgi:hypothetical protein
MKVHILVTVEDSNEFPLDEPLAGVQPYTIGHRKHRWHISRVDKLRAGIVADLPQSQASNLISLGYAKAA